uniref:Uncharacterized protein n=1 Tax=Parascaris equorum TaxID=6256 RepID=A0A914S1D2_PAREQ
MTIVRLSATCSWDSSIHDHPALNKPSGGNEQIYAILKIDIIIRKRICMHIYKKASLTERLMKKIVGTVRYSAHSVFLVPRLFLLVDAVNGFVS